MPSSASMRPSYCGFRLRVAVTSVCPGASSPHARKIRMGYRTDGLDCLDRDQSCSSYRELFGPRACTQTLSWSVGFVLTIHPQMSRRLSGRLPGDPYGPLGNQEGRDCEYYSS